MKQLRKSIILIVGIMLLIDLGGMQACGIVRQADTPTAVTGEIPAAPVASATPAAPDVPYLAPLDTPTPPITNTIPMLPSAIATATEQMYATLIPAASPTTTTTVTLPITTPVAPDAPTRPPFPADEMLAILGQAGGDFGVVVYDVPHNALVYTHQQDLSFSAASLIKMPIAVAVYQLASAEALSLDTPLVMQAEDIVGGSGSLQYEPAGTTYTIRELCARMISDSDNTAANMLVEYIGGFAVVNETMRQVGTTNTIMQRYLMDLEAMQAGRDNLTSPADMQLLLQLLAQDELAGAGELRAALEQTSDTQKLPALLPANVIVQHKIGTLTGVEHDVGIVYPPSSSHYIAVFMSNGLSSNQAGITAIAEASRLVYDYFTESVAAGDEEGDAPGETAAMPSPTPVPPLRYVFPVDSAQVTYGPYHHDYPATDIFCPIGSPYLATTSGVVDFVNANDRWDPTTDVPADRGGIMLAIIGDDGWRYYGSHLSGIAAGIIPGVRVDAGQLLGWTGNSGNARWTDPHLHYGISPPTFPEDWQTRRGEIPPYSYLQAWQRGESITPQDEGEEG